MQTVAISDNTPDAASKNTMSVLPIQDYTNSILRRKAQRVEQVTPEIRRLIRDMRETMKAAAGVGLAAPQVGRGLSIVIYDTGEEKGTLIDPTIIEQSGEQVGPEGCLSIPGLQGDVSRALAVVVTGLDERGRPIRIESEGYLARILQHEIDHINGVLFIDRAAPETLRKLSPGTMAA